MGYKVPEASILSIDTPGTIDIKFVDTKTKEIYTGDSPSYAYSIDSNGMPSSDRTPSNWYTHPAFDFGGTPLTGIWVGKFQLSVTKTADCYNKTSSCTVKVNELRILPDVTTIRYMSISEQFEKLQNLITQLLYGLSGDAHLKKNSEWAAVAYLSQSIYGKYGNSIYSEKNKEVYINNYYYSTTNGYITGVSEEAAGVSTSETVVCRYNDITNRGGGTGACDAGASTTGNIYGLYDISDNNGGFGDSWFTIESNKKYNDMFTTSNPGSVRTKETIGYAFFETLNWYNDDDIREYNYVRPRVIRGGNRNDSNDAGLFYFSRNTGSGNYYFSFKITLLSMN